MRDELVMDELVMEELVIEEFVVGLVPLVPVLPDCVCFSHTSNNGNGDNRQKCNHVVVS